MKATWKIMFAVLLSVVLAMGSGCKKETPVNPGNNNGGGGNTTNDVRVTTYTPRNITQTTAECGGDVVVKEGVTLTEIGVCWGTECNPTPEGFHKATENWNEPFVCTLTELEPATRYYVRAYALRGIEYYYGVEKNFTTEAGGGGGSGTPPTIEVYQEPGYLQDGDVLDIDVQYQFGFELTSETGLASLRIDVDDYEWTVMSFDSLTISDYTYLGVISFEYVGLKDNVRDATITGVVTDKNGRTNSASIHVSINQLPQPLVASSFEWVQQGSNSLNEEEINGAGLAWGNSNYVFDTVLYYYTDINLLNGSTMYLCDGDDFVTITTDVEKVVYFANLTGTAIAVESYRILLLDYSYDYNDMLAVIDPDGGQHLIHITHVDSEVIDMSTIPPTIQVIITGKIK